MKNPAHKLSKVLVAAAAMLFGVASAHADAYIINNYQWNFTVDSSGAATVTGAKTNPGGEEPSGVFKIPSSINGHTVKAISSGAFASCCNVTALELPSTLETIGEGAFYECDSITRLYVPASVTSIGYEAFAYCSSLRSVHLPRKAFLGKIDTSEIFRASASGLDIRYYATAASGGYTWHYEVVSRKGLYSAEIARPDPDVTAYYEYKGPAITGLPSSGTCTLAVPSELGGYNVTSIGESAFRNCTVLAGATIPDSVTNIGFYAFMNCSGLESVTIPQSVMSIGLSAFLKCNGLTNVTIPDGVAGIGGYAFSECSGLNSVTIPPSVTAIGKGVFDESPLKTVHVAPGDSSRVRNLLRAAGSSASGIDFRETRYVGRAYTYGNYTWYYTVKDGCAKVIGGQIYPGGAELFGYVTVPSAVAGYSVTEIGDSAFTELDLTSVVIPQAVKRIGEGAFYDCASLTSVAMPGVETIGEVAFEGCVKLANVDLPDSLKTIGVEAFDGCPLKTLSLGANVASVGNMAFGEIDFESVTLESQAAVNSFESAFEYSTIASLTLGGSLKVGDNAFCKRSDLKSVTIGGSVQLGDFAFADCANLKSVTIGKDVSGAWEGGFKWCDSLTSVTLEPGLDAIGAEGFEFCESLTSIAIPSSVTSIESDAFWGTGLTKVYVDAGDTSRVRAMLEESGFSTSGITFVDPAPAVYTINFHRNDANDGKTAEYEFDYGVSTALPTLKELGWARRGFDFKGWATSAANAAAGKVWKKDGAAVSTATAAGKRLDVYAVWALKSGYYAVQFIRNDGAGTWRTIGFPYGTKTAIPTLAKGLGWARRGYEFKGWETTTAAANDNTRANPWKTDGAYISTPVAAGKTLTVYARWQLKSGYYQIRFNKNDGTGKWRTLGFECGKSTKLSTIAALGWTRSGHAMVGWASSKANADAGKVWKLDGAWIKDGTAEGKTLSIYAIWK